MFFIKIRENKKSYCKNCNETTKTSVLMVFGEEKFACDKCGELK